MSVVCAALVPAAPVLVPGLSGRVQPAAEAQDGARSVLRQLIDSSPDKVVVVAEGDHDGSFDQSADLALYRLGGLPRPQDGEIAAGDLLPLPLAIGAALLDDAGWAGATSYRLLNTAISSSEAAAYGAQLDDGDSRVGLLLLGNGSAKSSAKAPGSFDPNSEQFNAALLAMIEQGDRIAMSGLSADAAREQMSDVRLPLQVLAGVGSLGAAAGVIGYANEFRGVYYVCAAFNLDGSLA